MESFGKICRDGDIDPLTTGRSTPEAGNSPAWPGSTGTACRTLSCSVCRRLSYTDNSGPWMELQIPFHDSGSDTFSNPLPSYRSRVKKLEPVFAVRFFFRRRCDGPGIWKLHLVPCSCHAPFFCSHIMLEFRHV